MNNKRSGAPNHTLWGATSPRPLDKQSYISVHYSWLWPSEDDWRGQGGWERSATRMREGARYLVNAANPFFVALDAFYNKVAMPWYIRLASWTLGVDGMFETRMTPTVGAVLSGWIEDIERVPTDDPRWNYLLSMSALRRRLAVSHEDPEKGMAWVEAEIKRGKDAVTEERGAKRIGARFIAPLAIPLLAGVTGAAVQKLLGIK